MTTEPTPKLTDRISIEVSARAVDVFMVAHHRSRFSKSQYCLDHRHLAGYTCGIGSKSFAVRSFVNPHQFAGEP
jgi:hypothetical protein